MLFLEEKAPSVRLALLSGTLLAGEAAGFTLRMFVDAWGWFVFSALVSILVVYGLGIRRLAFVVVFMLGGLLALCTDARLKGVLDANAGLRGPRSPLALKVEGPVVRRPCTKTGAWIVEFPSQIGPVPLKVLMHVGHRDRVPLIDETWRVDGWMSRPRGMENRYRRRVLWVSDVPRACCIAEISSNSARACWNVLGEELATRVGAGLSWCPEIAGLNRAILLGRRSELSPERKRAFVDAGTIHVFAISGLHVMVVAWFLSTLLGFLDFPSRIRGLVSLPLIWGYVVLTGARPSAIRAAMMLSFMFVAPVLGRRPDALSAWSLTVFAVYGVSPERMFDLGCSLSFTVMFGIVLWCHWSEHFQPWFAKGSWLREKAGSFGVSCAAWVAGVPIAAHAFGRFTPGGLIANLVVIEFAKGMVRLGAGALATSFICLPLAALLNNGTALLTWVMALVSERVAALPFSSFDVTPWSITTCGLWYAAWFVILYAAGKVLPRRSKVATRWW